MYTQCICAYMYMDIYIQCNMYNNILYNTLIIFMSMHIQNVYINKQIINLGSHTILISTNHKSQRIILNGSLFGFGAIIIGNQKCTGIIP